MIATPPFQTPDAPNHFYRALQVSDGHFIGQYIDGVSGGYVDSGAFTYADNFSVMPFRREVKLTTSLLNKAPDAWSGTRQLVPFPNTAIYPGYAYVPQALAITVARLGGAQVLHTYRLACASNFIFSLALVFLSLRLARKTSLALFSCALLPTSQMLFTSVSQDATLIGLAFVIIAAFDRLTENTTELTRTQIIAAAICLLICISSRPPYVGLLPLIFSPRLGSMHGYRLATRVMFACGVGVLAAVIAVYAQHVTHLPPPAGVSTRGQLAHLAAHPGELWSLATQTLRSSTGFVFESFVGNLGWLDAPLHDTYYVVSGLILVLMLLASVSTSTNEAAVRLSLRPGAAAVALSSLVGTCALVYGAMYLTWTVVGAPIVNGVQGRYLTPVVPLIAFVAPVVRVEDKRCLSRALVIGTSGARLLVIAFPIYSFTEIVQGIIQRYYVAM